MTTRHRFLLRILGPAALSLGAATAIAGPCERPSDFVRGGDAPLPGRAAMVTPFVVNGMAVVALRQRDGERWLEVAADSAVTVRRALASNGTADARVIEDGGAVLLACQGAPKLTRPVALTAQRPLW